MGNIYNRCKQKRHSAPPSDTQRTTRSSKRGNGWVVDGAQSNHYSVNFLQKYGIFMTKGQQRC